MGLRKIKLKPILFISALLNFYYVFYSVHYTVLQEYMCNLYINIHILELYTQIFVGGL